MNYEDRYSLRNYKLCLKDFGNNVKSFNFQELMLYAVFYK